MVGTWFADVVEVEGQNYWGYFVEARLAIGTEVVVAASFVVVAVEVVPAATFHSFVVDGLEGEGLAAGDHGATLSQRLLPMLRVTFAVCFVEEGRCKVLVVRQAVAVDVVVAHVAAVDGYLGVEGSHHRGDGADGDRRESDVSFFFASLVLSLLRLCSHCVVLSAGIPPQQSRGRLE